MAAINGVVLADTNALFSRRPVSVSGNFVLEETARFSIDR